MNSKDWEGQETQKVRESQGIPRSSKVREFQCQTKSENSKVRKSGNSKVRENQGIPRPEKVQEFQGQGIPMFNRKNRDLQRQVMESQIPMSRKTLEIKL